MISLEKIKPLFVVRLLHIFVLLFHIKVYCSSVSAIIHMFGY